MGGRSIRDNILMQYTVISLLLTIILASLLSWLVSIQLRDQLVYMHGDFYRAYIEAVELNYSEVIPLITGNEASENLDQHKHGHEGEGSWDHFESDLVQFPYVKQFRILNTHGDIVWKYRSEDYIKQLDSLFDGMDTWYESDEGFKILKVEENLAVGYMIPAFIDGNHIGDAHIIDLDPNLQHKIRITQIRTVSLIFMGGVVFYFSLFLLYYRVHRKQARTIDQLDQSQTLTIETMSRLAELRDDNTGAHIRRTSLYCRVLANELSKREKKSKYITREYIRDLERSAPLHDIGKVGVPDHILQKPGPLTEAEFEIIKTHPVMGADVLHEASEKLGFQSFFEIGYQIVLYHHENWDGSGYPEGLSGEEIPLSARIMSVADVYDALTTDRPYKEAFSHEKAIETITKESGKKFDPQLIDALTAISDQFRDIAKEFAD